MTAAVSWFPIRESIERSANPMQASSEITQSLLINLDGKKSTKPC